MDDQMTALWDFITEQENTIEEMSALLTKASNDITAARDMEGELEYRELNDSASSSWRGQHTEALEKAMRAKHAEIFSTMIGYRNQVKALKDGIKHFASLSKTAEEVPY